MELHARKVKDSTGKIREFTILRLWSLYHLGHVLNELCPHGGARPQGVVLNKLAEFGIDWRLSVRSRDIAAIDTEDLRVFIEESGDAINVSHLLRLHTESETDPPAWDEEANWRMVISVVRDYFERGTDEYRLMLVKEFLGKAIANRPIASMLYDADMGLKEAMSENQK
jgi:hypothetical protein